MTKPSRLLQVILALISGYCVTALAGGMVERQTVTVGSFKTLHIGMSKEDALTKLKEMRVDAVKPIPALQFSLTHSQTKDLAKLNDVEGFRVSNGKGFAIDVFLDRDVVQLVRKSFPAEQTDWFHVGQSRRDAIDAVRRVLEVRRDLVVVPTVLHKGDGWVNLNDATRKQMDSLHSHDAWLASLSSAVEKPAGAELRAYFRDGRLTKVDYRRPRARLD